MSLEYTIYIANNCHDCDTVIAHYKTTGMIFDIINYDTENHSKLAIPLFAFPALCKGERILAYGIDIVPYLDKIKDSKSANKESKEEVSAKKKSFFKRLFGNGGA